LAQGTRFAAESVLKNGVECALKLYIGLMGELYTVGFDWTIFERER
jgi:hypothetical protein